MVCTYIDYYMRYAIHSLVNTSNLRSETNMKMKTKIIECEAMYAPEQSSVRSGICVLNGVMVSNQVPYISPRLRQ